MKYPYETRFPKGSRTGCVPAKSIKQAKDYVRKYAHEIDGTGIIVKLAEYYPQIEVKLFEFDSTGKITAF